MPSLYDYLASPESFAFVSGDMQQRMNREGSANMLRALSQGPKKQLGLPNYKDWYFPGEMPTIHYTQDLPPGYLGNYWPARPDMITMRPAPKPGMEELYRHFNPLEVLVHENTHRTQTEEPVGNYYEVDQKYFPREKDRQQFVKDMLKWLGVPEESFYQTYNTPILQMDEIRARLMGMDALMPPGKPIWTQMRPDEISWFLESTRKGWNPGNGTKGSKSR